MIDNAAIHCSSIKSFNTNSDVASGHHTPVSITEDNSTKLDEKLDKKGHERGSMAYDIEEHLTLLHFVFFYSSKTSSEWRAVYKAMCHTMCTGAHCLDSLLPCMHTLLTCMVPLRRLLEFFHQALLHQSVPYHTWKWMIQICRYMLQLCLIAHFRQE